MNSSVLSRRRRNTVSDGDKVTSGERLFQTRAADTKKERSPMVECTVLGTTSAVDATERNRCRDSTSATR